MRFLSCLLTLQYHTRQNPLTFAEQHQLQQEVQAVFFPSTHVQHLLSVACLHSDQHQLVLRLTLAEEQHGDALASLLSRVHSGRPVQLCQRRGTIRVCDFSDRIWTRVSTWADFQAGHPPASFHITFATPLLTAPPLTRQQPNALPFPEPEVIFTPALEHWRNLSGPPLAGSAQQMVQATRCVLATYCLHTVDIPALRAIGYLGWAEYRCFQPQAEARTALWALASLTFFTGCGYETAAGFGTTRLVLRE